MFKRVVTVASVFLAPVLVQASQNLHMVQMWGQGLRPDLEVSLRDRPGQPGTFDGMLHFSGTNQNHGFTLDFSESLPQMEMEEGSISAEPYAVNGNLLGILMHADNLQSIGSVDHFFGVKSMVLTEFKPVGAFSGYRSVAIVSYPGMIGGILRARPIDESNPATPKINNVFTGAAHVWLGFIMTGELTSRGPDGETIHEDLEMSFGETWEVMSEYGVSIGYTRKIEGQTGTLELKGSLPLLRQKVIKWDKKVEERVQKELR